MIGDHVAQGAGRLVEMAAFLHADRFRRRDLYMIDAVAVPDRLEQSIGKAKRHDALDRILAEKVVDAEYLVLVQRAPDVGVQFARRTEAMAERLLDHHAAPEPALAVFILLLIGELGLAELLYHGAEQPIRDREIEDGIALGAVSFFGFAQRGAKTVVQLGLVQVAADIDQPVREALPHLLVDVVDIERGGIVANEALQRVVKLGAPGFSTSLRPRHPDQHEVLRQHPGAREVVECRHYQALGQVPGGAKDHHGAGVGRLGLLPRRRRYHLHGARHPL